jgi:hypothetical protein
MLSLQIFEVRYLDLIKRCHQQQLPFGIAWIKQGSEVQVPGEVPALHSLGCLAHIREMEQVQPNFFRIVCQGGLRFELHDVQARLKGLGGEPGNISPEEFSRFNRQEFERFGRLIKQANIKMN